ncbi:nicotinate-nicotinamide nucleotide adenylyltransferase [Massilia eurypsychrophila]|uniref:Probable nicotinate-nucleotide adenylyltransferase n=1 Tax=Massilia eurypsychrophila TaxID=1485217 RepID=A0A2G8TEE6_9BURK|nr:nicotinate-nucleotide adenylyltransferase [Massilia eurypsychrophila]PIL44436.1 nicotinate-nicotinamide nucleotide adenylyltransferase [Massilia eurypsychrophila]
MTTCVALLGGSFDPVHHAHVALAALFAQLLRPDQLRIVPAGNPWQKNALNASADERVAMIELAFRAAAVTVTIDRREIARGAPTYTVDTLREVRAELGPDASIVFLIGADQLQQLDSWRDWKSLFDYAHIGVAARPGYALDAAALPSAVAREIETRQGSLEQLRTTPSGRIFLAETLAVDISATQIRAALQRGEQANSLIPEVVLDYIQQHNLYKI